MKTKALIIALLPIFLISCAKDEESTGIDNDSPSNNLGDAKEGHHLKNIICDLSPLNVPEDCFCYYPPTNCLVMVVIRPRQAAFESLNDAIDNNQQVGFFSTGDYKDIMPGLDDYPSYLTDLINGDKIFVEVGAKNPNERIYALVDKSVQSNFDESDIVLSFAFEI